MSLFAALCISLLVLWGEPILPVLLFTELVSIDVTVTVDGQSLSLPKALSVQHVFLSGFLVAEPSWVELQCLHCWCPECR
jgi:hypothetical protein